MFLSVGLFYSTQEFLELIGASAVDGDAFSTSNSRFRLSLSADVYSLAQACGWIEHQLDGKCLLSQRGRALVSESSAIPRLRCQIADVIGHIRPTWSHKVSAGRREAVSALPREVEQIFKEAQLLGSLSDVVVDWWDSASAELRSFKGSARLKVGRQAERLSIAYESERIGRMPIWQAVESNYAGYDILSSIDSSSERNLLIEVKGSKLKLKEACFHVTRHEWRTAKSSESYEFHIWCLNSIPKLMVVNSHDILDHIPSDNGDGRWESVEIPFHRFKAYATKIDVSRLDAIVQSQLL